MPRSRKLTREGEPTQRTPGGLEIPVPTSDSEPAAKTASLRRKKDPGMTRGVWSLAARP